MSNYIFPVSPDSKYIKPIFLFYILFSLILSEIVYAGGFYLQELGTPSSIGTAGTGRTTNNYGAETAWGNPAGMVGIDKTTLLNGAQVLIPNSKFDSDIAQAGGSDGGNAGEPAIIPSMFFVKPVSEDMRVGFSVTAPLGGGFDYGNDFVGRYAVQDISLQGVALSPSIGYRVNEAFSIGAGVSFLYTIFEYDFAINNPGNAADGKVKIEDADDWGAQFFAGLQYQFNAKTRMGVVYRSKADVDLSGDIEINNSLLPIQPEGRAKIGWDNPQLVEVGLSYEVNDNLTVYAQADWEDWSEFSYNSFEISGSSGINIVKAIDRDFKDTYRFGVGAEYEKGEHIFLFGTSYDSSPVSDSNRTLDLPLDEQFRLSTAYIVQRENKWDYSLSASFVYFGDGKVDQTSQGVRTKGEFDKNWGLFLGGTIRHEF